MVGTHFPCNYRLLGTHLPCYSRHNFVLRFPFSPQHINKRKLRQVGALQIWSAVTCHRFLLMSIVAVALTLSSTHRCRDPTHVVLPIPYRQLPTDFPCPYRLRATHHPCYSRLTFVRRFPFSSQRFNKRKLRQVGALQIWSAVTCHRFLLMSIVAAALTLSFTHRCRYPTHVVLHIHVVPHIPYRQLATHLPYHY
jgi:hypothetical protein